MIAPVLCIAAFVACYLAGRRSLGWGLVALLGVGYAYGILRANLLTIFSHFIFDAGMFGLYLSHKWLASNRKEAERMESVRWWAIVLIAWPMLLVLMPFQPWLVSLVGLRGNMFFVPILLMGSRLIEKDRLQLSTGLAVLNLIAAAFAVAEYFIGVTRFFPLNPVTLIIYSSGDVAGGFFRIPSTFSSAAAYGGTMVSTLPYLFGLWTRSPKPFLRYLALVAIFASMVGVLMSATRSNFVFGCAMVLFIFFTTRMQKNTRIVFVLLIAVVATAALTNVRFQRFKSLSDTDYVAERIAGSVNRGFWEILSEYPMGNGLGGGGTSLPYFLYGQVRNPIGMENEYARILSEQGIIGLLLWLLFIGWYLFRLPVAFSKTPWSNTRKLLWCLTVISLSTAWLGTGLLSSIPGTVLLMLGIGWTAVRNETESPAAMKQIRIRPAASPQTYAAEMR